MFLLSTFEILNQFLINEQMDWYSFDQQTCLLLTNLNHWLSYIFLGILNDLYASLILRAVLQYQVTVELILAIIKPTDLFSHKQIFNVGNDCYFKHIPNTNQ